MSDFFEEPLAYAFTTVTCQIMDNMQKLQLDHGDLHGVRWERKQCVIEAKRERLGEGAGEGTMEPKAKVVDGRGLRVT